MIFVRTCICILFIITGAKLTAGCDYSLVLPKALRVDSENYIYMDFHDCPPVVKISTKLHSLPRRQNTHSSYDVVDQPTNVPIKLTYVPNSKRIEMKRRRKTPEKKASVTINYCFGEGCQFSEQPLISFKVKLNYTHGYVFMTTDRPAYRPGETIQISVAGLAQSLTVASAELPLPSVTIKIKNGVIFYYNVSWIGPTQRENKMVVKTLAKVVSNCKIEIAWICFKSQTPESLGRMSVHDKVITVNEFGLMRHTYEIPKDPMPGVWWAEAVMNNQVMAITSFIIDKYVLPTFDVKLEMDQHFILPWQDSIKGKIKAHYSYGEPVNGLYYLSCKLQHDGTETDFYRIPSSFYGEAIISGGEKVFNIPTSELLNKTAHLSLEEFIGGDAKVIILATVTGMAQAVYESDLVDDIIFARSPYIIDLSHSAKFFFPERIYEIKAVVKDVVSGRPVPEVPVKITVDTNVIYITSGDNGEIYHAENLDSQRDQENILISTAHEKYRTEDQYHTNLVVDKYEPKTELGIQLKKQFIDVGDVMYIELRLGEMSPNDLRYYVVSRGEIVYADTRHLDSIEGGDVSVNFVVTSQMVPFSRVVVYYFLNGEVTANSAWFDVTDQCVEEISIEPQSDKAMPGDTFEFTIKGPPNARIEFSAVDRAAYFVHNSSRLTQNTLWSKMEAYDNGCSRKGGKNAMSVFKEAGLLYQSAKINNQDYYTDVCAPEGGARKKRAVRLDPVADAAAKVHKCKLDGQRMNTFQLTCGERLKIVEANLEHKHASLRSSCRTAFEEACVALEYDFYGQESVSRSISANDRANEIRERKRRDFRENWFFSEKTLRDNGKVVIEQTVPDSITTYEIAAFGMNKVSPFCIAKPKEVRVFKNVFIQVYLPYSVRVWEQAVIRFAVFNYGENDIEVTVKVGHSKEICTNFISDGFQRLDTMTISPHSSKSSHFTILPIKIPDDGKAKIELKAENYDYVEKMLLIEPPGQHNESHSTFMLSPDVDIDFKFDLAKNYVLPRTRKCYLYFYGHIMGPNIEVELDGRLANLQNYIRAPGGCGEQNMIKIAPVVYIHDYRNVTFTVTNVQQDQTIKYIQEGYAHELNYRTEVPQGKAFAVWKDHTPSTWLNGFVSRVFASARKYWPGMEVDAICQALSWLLTQQAEDGHFVEQHSVYHQEMNGEVTNDITMTAYICISLREASTLCSKKQNRKFELAMDDGIGYLKNHFDDAKNTPYTVAMVAYALAIFKPNGQYAALWNRRLISLKIEDTHFVYWQGTRGRAANIETTAYGLLAEISLNGVTKENYSWTKKIADWLISQRNDQGGFISTQDTVVAIQALTTYMTMLETAFQKIPVDLTVTLSSSSKLSTWFDNHTEVAIREGDTMKRITVPQDVLDQPVTVNVVGTGEGSMSYRCTWRQYRLEDECHFQVNVSVVEAQEDDKKMVKIIVSKTGKEAQMSIIDVVLLSGFEADEDSVKMLENSKVVDGLVDRYELTDNNIKFYLRSIDENEKKFAFNIKQLSVVKNLQPASVTVYDYYEPDIKCTKFYSIGDSDFKLRTSCEKKDGEVMCKCAEGDCPVCRSQNDQITNTKCSSHHNQKNLCNDLCELGIGCYDLHAETCKRDYVYVIQVLSVDDADGSGFKTIQARIAEVIRTTPKHIDPIDAVVKFRIRNDCYVNNCTDPRFEKIARSKWERNGTNGELKVLNFIEEGRYLLIYGSNPMDMGRNSSIQYIYDLDDNARLEIVPDEQKCSTVIPECAPGDEACRKQKKKIEKIHKLCKIKSSLKEAHLLGCDI